MSFEPQAQFSIYKIDEDLTKEVLDISENKDDVDDYLAFLCEKILNTIESVLKEKICESKCKIKKDNFVGVVFKTKHFPEWRGTINSIISNNEFQEESQGDDFIINKNVSYVLLYQHRNCIYAMTGGFGSHYIKKLIERNYGLYLIPKIVSANHPIVKKVMENNLTGNRISTQRANRNNTSISVEQDLSSIYNELNIQVEKEVAGLLGIEFRENEPENKKLNIVNKDSIVVRRSLTFSELKKVIDNLNKVERKKDHFALNYLMPAKKIGLKGSELTEALVEDFVAKKYDKFTLVGDDFESYYFHANSYKVFDHKKNVFIEQEDPIELKLLLEKIEIDKSLTKSLVTNVVKKWTITTTDNAGKTLLYPTELINVLQGFIENYGQANKTCYLINGLWYVFDIKYTEKLNKEYKELYDLKKEEAENIKTKFCLEIDVKTENEYNAKLKDNENLIVAHNVLYENVEIADVIFFDEDTLYLMHNKTSFPGVGARDSTNQIITASEYLLKKLGIDNTFLDEYYDKLCRKNDVNIHPIVSKEEFVDIFLRKNICFIAGYLKGYKKNTRSNYAKYLTIDLHKKLSARGQKFIPMIIK